jgi:O-methyltransferase
MDDRNLPTEVRESQRMYLDLLKTVLTRTGFSGSYRLVGTGRGWHRYALPTVRWLLARFGGELVLKPDGAARSVGGDYPSDAETMIGMARLTNIEQCLIDLLERDIPGDVIETGVWRGGAVIFMRAVLRAYGDQTRVVWAADSFEGLPSATLSDRETGADHFWKIAHLAVSEDEVRANFEKYGLLDERVRFLRGWFRDTLATAPIERLSLLRLDGDMYESTMDALSALYPKLSPGGYVIVDDYAITACRNAVEDYRREFAIEDPIEQIDWTGVFWKKSAGRA